MPFFVLFLPLYAPIVVPHCVLPLYAPIVCSHCVPWVHDVPAGLDNRMGIIWESSGNVLRIIWESSPLILGKIGLHCKARLFKDFCSKVKSYQ